MCKIHIFSWSVSHLCFHSQASPTYNLLDASPWAFLAHLLLQGSTAHLHIPACSRQWRNSIFWATSKPPWISFFLEYPSQLSRLNNNLQVRSLRPRLGFPGLAQKSCFKSHDSFSLSLLPFTCCLDYFSCWWSKIPGMSSLGKEEFLPTDSLRVLPIMFGKACSRNRRWLIVLCPQSGSRDSVHAPDPIPFDIESRTLAHVMAPTTLLIPTRINMI